MYIGCIMYADDLVLISSSVCELQRMFDLCADNLTEIGMLINTKKCAILRFGPQHANLFTTGFRILRLKFVIKLNISASSCSLVNIFQLI